MFELVFLAFAAAAPQECSIVQIDYEALVHGDVSAQVAQALLKLKMEPGVCRWCWMHCLTAMSF